MQSDGLPGQARQNDESPVPDFASAPSGLQMGRGAEHNAPRTPLNARPGTGAHTVRQGASAANPLRCRIFCSESPGKVRGLGISCVAPTTLRFMVRLAIIWTP